MRLTSLLSFFVVAVLLTATQANDWVGGSSNNLWNDDNNWLQATTMWVNGQEIPGPDISIVPPDATTHPNFGWDDPGGLFYPLTADPSDDLPRWVNDVLFRSEGTTTIIDSTTSAFAYGVRIGLDGASNTLEMTGGQLQIGGIPPGETDRVGWHLDVGRGFNRSSNPNPVARMVMTGGFIDTNLIKVPEQFVDPNLAEPYDTPGINGEFIMSGGLISARKLNLGQFTGNGYGELSGDAVINLWPNVASNRNNGGFYEMKQDWFIDGQPVSTVADAYLDIRDEAVINIFGHIGELSLTPDQSEFDRYQQYIDDGWLTANNGADEPIITLQPCPADGTFDDMCFGAMMITISAPPPAQPACDFDANGLCDIQDLDALVAAIASGSNDLLYDMTGDGAVTLDDVTDTQEGWLRAAGEENIGPGRSYLQGDINLDTIVDGLDFIAWNDSKFTSTGLWSLGDLNADNVTDGLDFITWNTNKFTSSDVHSIPEPSSWGISLLVFLAWRRIYDRSNVE